jgi:para-nitrobenzyl esterase
MVLLETPIGRMLVGWEPWSNAEAGDEAAGIARCLNLQYATIPYRWAAPRPVELPWDGVRDCTSFGPGCPQQHEPLFNVKGVPLFGIEDSTSVTICPEAEDEFKCLNLNIYLPTSRSPDGSVKVGGKLPVFLWVHGGAYVVGSGNVDAYGK